MTQNQTYTMKLVKNKSCQLSIMLLASIMASAGIASRFFILGGIGFLVLIMAYYCHKRSIIKELKQE